MNHVTQPEQRVPVVHEVDVVVAGAGIAGIFAALGAARQGADTLLIDRFGMPGGNLGPAFLVAGSLTGWPGNHIERNYDDLTQEFLTKHAACGGGAVRPFRMDMHQLRDSNVASYVALRMLQDAGVKLMFSCFACDPIMAADRVTGLFIENKSGRQAVQAPVLIDATGEADVARRAGAPILYPDPKGKSVGRSMGLCFMAAGVDWRRYQAWGDYETRQQRHAEIVDQAAEAGEFTLTREVPGLGTIRTFQYQRCGAPREGLASGYAGVDWPDHINQGDGAHISTMEIALRTHAFETVQFWQRHIPGFEKAYVALIAPYLGSRGGPSIEGQYVLTRPDIEQQERHDDVIYRFGRYGRDIRYDPIFHSVPPKRTDIPYRVMLPQQITGLLAAGRSASSNPGSLMRTRPALMLMGQAAGIAAALSAQNRVTPDQLDVKTLQRTLLERGFYLGDRARLTELKLI